MEEHLVHWREVFSCLQAAALTVKLSKVQFATSQLSFLGHLISAEGFVLIRRELSLSVSSRRPEILRTYRGFWAWLIFFRSLFLT